MRAHQAHYPVRTLCRVLGVSPSGYYAYVRRPPSRRAVEDAGLLERIEHFHARSRGTYGAPRIHRDLREEDEVQVGIRRVGRLMRQAGIVGISRRKRRMKTTRRDLDGRPAPDLVDRDFRATGPDQLWVADITYVPTHAGFLYLAVVVDAWSRRVVGWSMANHLRTELVLTALEMALQQRQPADVIHDSDQGCQYTSYAFGKRCRQAGVRPSMGSVGDAYDNALCESFFATLECELLDRRRVRSQTEARMAVFDFVEGWYNPSVATRRLITSHPSNLNESTKPQRAQALNRPPKRINSIHRQCRVSLRAATTFPTPMRLFREATLGRLGKRPTPCTQHYDKPPERSKSFRSSRHRQHGFSELALTPRVTWEARNLRGARRNTH